MLRKIFFCFPLLSLALAFGQAGSAVAPQVAFKVVNGFTTPIPNAVITVCAANTGGLPCAPALANSIFKDTALTQPLSNPFTSDSSGNYQFAILPGNYTVTVTASGYAGNSYQITVAIPNGASALLTLNNVWSGLNVYSNGVTFDNAVTIADSLNGILVLGTQGGAGGLGYIQFGTGSFTQNTLSRFDSSGDLVNSFWTDSGAIGAYTGVNGIFSPSYNTNGSGSGFVGISQGTLPASCNGGVDTLVADTNTTLMVDCKNQSGTTYYAYEVEAQPYYDNTGLTATVTPTLQAAAPAASQWRFSVNANQISTSSCTANAGNVGGVVIKLAYTDSQGLETVTVATLTFVTSGVATAGGSFPFRVNSTNNILMSATYTNCTAGTGTYDIHAWLERVK